jgi:hypothetical protein
MAVFTTRHFKMIKIYSPIWVNENGAYFSISKWNFQKETNLKEIEIRVYNGQKLAGKGTIDKRKWIKTAKLKEKKIVFRPEEPLIFYYNIMKFEKPLSEEENLKQMAQSGVFG